MIALSMSSSGNGTFGFIMDGHRQRSVCAQRAAARVPRCSVHHGTANGVHTECERRITPTPTRRRCRAGARRSAGPGCEGRGWVGLAGAGRRRRRDARSTPPATRSTSPGSSGPGGHGQPIAEAPPAGEVTALSGACLAIPRATWRGGRRLPRALLPLPRGRRPLAAAAAARRRARDRARRGGRPRLRVRRPRAQVALAGAQPLGLPDPRLPGARCWLLLPPALLATELALIPAAIAGGWGRQKLAATSKSSAGCRACCASAARSRRPARSAPPSSPPGSPPTSTPPSSRRRRPLGPGAPRPARLLARRPPAARGR